MTFNKQVRLYLIDFPNEKQNLLCPAQSTEHVRSMLGKIDNAEIYYLGWTKISYEEESYQVENFIAQENGDALTGKEMNTFQKYEKNLPQVVIEIINFLDEYYYDERLDDLETQLQCFWNRLASLKNLKGEKTI